MAIDTQKSSEERDRSAAIVVGVDGSPSSRHALEWAILEAETRGSRVLAITTYLRDAMASAAPFASWDPSLSHELADRAQRVVSDEVSVLSKVHPTVRIDIQVIEGLAASVLIEASRKASALVVGSRGHGPLVGLLIGSVSQHCVIQAHCPVVVVGPEAHIEKHRYSAIERSAGVTWCPP